MRRLSAPVVSIAVAASLLAACASPAVTLGLQYSVGTVRTYKVQATVDQTIDVAGLDVDERIVFEATTRIEVLDVGSRGATLRVRVTPTLLSRDGRKADPPQAQEVTVAVGQDGSIADVRPPQGTQVRIEELLGVAPLIGASLPSGRARLGLRWRRDLPPPTEGLDPGVQAGRLAAYRVVKDRRCAVVELDTRRALQLTRQAAGTQLNLTGNEVTATQVALDLAEGFPVQVTSDAEGRFAVQGAPSRPGDVVIKTKTVISLAG